ncbi:hypothetical protein SAMN05192555_10575 [Franzmannia pantelleriensis]|uniref:Uncharacterized protein n=1 Tax=Franzmannia pantelleriensis TaxID=48727 RepID=A0A1G9KW39_9GAMM|nr:hypothetical protein [Halomonas pantelleriensis]SDL53922.1 hypothetical protein SAMN05192555_10575 [Halomonas pantelleriensis]
MRHSLRYHIVSGLLLNLVLMMPILAYSDDLDAFAASLLCDQESCTPPDSQAPPVPLVIEGTTLPSDAARERDHEQAFLVRQGAYLTDQGTISSLTDQPASIQVPERGVLQAHDHGPADLVPTTGPVIIAIPRTSPSPQGSSRD